jgi:CRISPR-associated protein Cas1
MSGEPVLPPLKPIPIKDRISVAYIEKGNLDVLDGAFVVVDKNGVRTHIPVGGLVCLMLEPGTRVSHAAVTLASRVGCLLIWIGQQGVACILLVSRAGHGPIDSSTRLKLHSMMKPV